MTELSNIANTKSLFILLDHFSYANLLEKDQSPLSSETRSSIRTKGYVPTLKALIKKINNDQGSLKVIFDIFSIESIDETRITVNLIVKKILNKRDKRSDIKAALVKLENSSGILPGTKKLFKDALYILDFLTNEKTLSHGNRLTTQVKTRFNDKGMVPTIKTLFRSLSGDDKKVLAERFGWERYNNKNIRSQTLNKPDDDSDLDAALRVIETKPPTTAKGWSDRGRQNHHKKDYSGAVAAFTEAIKLNPSNAVFYYNRGFLFTKLGEHENAVKDFEEAKKLKPSDAETYYRLALSYMKLGRKKEVVKNYNEACKLNDKYLEQEYKDKLGIEIEEPKKELPVKKTPDLAQEMDNYHASKWQKANWSNGDPFNNTWQPDNVTFNNGIMTLTLDNKGCPESCDGKPYASGEYRTRRESYGYGLYEASMKAARGRGVNSTFFVYTGNYGKKNHHEIDFEFLGKNCRRVQTNYYVEGEGQHEKMIDLGFDACEDFHTYGFKWAENSIIWYVDGEQVREVKNSKIPYKKTKIMVNFWPGTGVDGWLEPFSYPSKPMQAQYDWIRFYKADAD